MTNEFEFLPSPHFLIQITITNWISTLPAQTSKFISDDLKVSIYFWYIPFLLKTDVLFCLFVRQYRSADQMVSFKRSDSIVQEVDNLPVFYSALTPIQRYPTRLITLSMKIHSFFFAIILLVHFVDDAAQCFFVWSVHVSLNIYDRSHLDVYYATYIKEVGRWVHIYPLRGSTSTHSV